MVNYVNTVLVGKGASALAESTTAYSSTDNNKFVVINAATGAVVNASTIAAADAIKIGFINGSVTNMDGVAMPNIKWSNVIKRDQIRSYVAHTYNSSDDATSEDKVEFTFTNAAATALANGKRIIVRVTYKDMPTRYRKWTDSFEYITSAADDTNDKIIAKLVDVINGAGKRTKRARVKADKDTVNHKLVLTAEKYTDDNSIDTINVAEKIRFNANIYMTDPSKTDFEFRNKYSIPGVSSDKIPGKTYPGDWKLVRDREAEAMGYLGILNRGEGTWPIIKPNMVTEQGATYNYIVLMFETMYRAADDIQRHTKECIEIYDKINENGTSSANVNLMNEVLKVWLNGNAVTGAHATDNLVDTVDANE